MQTNPTMVTMFRSREKQPIRLLYLNQYPIYKQLQLEEAILRTDTDQWCLINLGTLPAIVMGISGKREQLINPLSFKQKPVPIIRRFSGGGTVFVDHDTCFVTWICNSESVGIPCCPKQIMSWTEEVYRPFFPTPFALKENDYALGDRKFGGNAQYMRKNRWLHHTSFLWDYTESNMHYLLQPSRMPEYRQNRTHTDFLCRLRDHLPEKEQWLKHLIAYLKEQCTVQEIALEEAEQLLQRPHRKTTDFIETPAGFDA